MTTRGPVGTTWHEIAHQGAFRVFKQGGEGLDDMYSSFGPYPEGELKSRSRISWVEIDTSIDAVDVARIHFIDPERRVAGYVADLWTDPQQKLEVWHVIIGYHFMPESSWTRFTGVPVIEDTDFPQGGPPEVTIRLFAPQVAMLRRNSSTAPFYKPSRHWLMGPENPPSVKKALQAMAEAYNVGLFLGALEKIIDYVDEFMKAVYEGPSEVLINQKACAILTELFESLPGGTTRFFFSRVEEFTNLVKPFQGGPLSADMTDWSYLTWLKTKLQPLVNKLFEGEGGTGGISDTYFSKVKTAGNQVIYGFRDNDLHFCRLRDLDPKVDEIVMFSYQVLDHSLLSFRVMTEQVGGGADAASGLAKILAMRAENIKPQNTEETATSVKTGSDDPEARGDDPGAKTDPMVTRVAGDYTFRATTTSRADLLTTATEEEVLGMLATNLTAEATVVGAPFLRCGKLVATYGLGVTAENKPNPNEPQRINHLDRVWFVTGCTHRVDSSGFFITKLRLAGAGTDDSTKVPEKIAASLGATVDVPEQAPTGTKDVPFWQKLLQFIGIGRVSSGVD